LRHGDRVRCFIGAMKLRHVVLYKPVRVTPNLIGEELC
jgi:hypothetical protein